MFLGLVFEYLESINNEEVPVVISSFERVVQVESQRFVEEHFEEVVQRIKTEYDISLLPMEEEDLEKSL